MKQVYLAGAITHSKDPSSWRKIITALLRLQDEWTVIDPMHFPLIGNPTDIIAYDLKAIRLSHAVIAKVDEPSWGTGMEIFYAAKILNIPVIILVDDNAHLSPWLLCHCKIITYNITAAIAYLEQIR